MSTEYKVLLADDSAFSRKMAASYLAGSEFVVVAEAGNGNEAVSLFQKHSPDIVLLDIIMPEKTGPEALKEIVALSTAVKVLMLSSLGTEDMVTECLASGATTFVQKPFDQATLLTHLRDAMSG